MQAIENNATAYMEEIYPPHQQVDTISQVEEQGTMLAR